MAALTPVEVVEAFNAAINRRDVEGLTDLMSDDYTFIDSAGTVERGKESGIASWAGFFERFPDYRNHFERITEHDGRVLVTGHSHCSFGPLAGPAIWTARVNDGQVAVWQVHDDDPEQRLKLGLNR